VRISDASPDRHDREKPWCSGRRPWQLEVRGFRQLEEKLSNSPKLHMVERGKIVVVSGVFPLVDDRRWLTAT
jgi:hypothetical protein